MNKEHYIAFFDESGTAYPLENKNYPDYFVFSVIVIPFKSLAEINMQWRKITTKYFKIPEFEPKASNICMFLGCLKNEKKLPKKLKELQEINITPEDLTEYINSVIKFISCLNKFGAYSICTIINKEHYWEKELKNEYYEYQELSRGSTYGKQRRYKALKGELASAIYQKCFSETILKLEYSLSPKEKNGLCILLGDENYYHSSLAKAQKNLKHKISNQSLKNILNSPAFTSSKYNPAVQIADWISYITRQWIENNQNYENFNKIKNIFRHFNNKTFGYGIILLTENKE